jgi:hypothetical protein
MTKSKEKSNFWTTLPGILTGLASVITAIGAIHIGTNEGQISTSWTCYNVGKSVGDVSIWWGHTPGDAKWACDHWISTCGNEGGCIAAKISK